MRMRDYPAPRFHGELFIITGRGAVLVIPEEDQPLARTRGVNDVIYVKATHKLKPEKSIEGFCRITGIESVRTMSGPRHHAFLIRKLDED